MNLIERIFSIILPVFIIIGIGYAYACVRGPVIRQEMHSVNRLTTSLLAPLLVFTALSAKNFDLAHNVWLLLTGALIALGSGVLAWPIARALGYDVRTFAPPMMYNNCVNMGLPLALLAFGVDGLSGAVVLLVACNVVYFTLGIRIVQMGHVGHEGAMRRLLTGPMMLSMYAGIIFALMHWHLPPFLFLPLKMLGDASVGLMLFSLGVRMIDIERASWRIGIVGAVVCPLAGLAVALLLDRLLPLNALQRSQMFLFAALPPGVFCFMVAETYQQEPDKVAAMVLLGNLAALLFVPLGLWLALQ